MRAAVYLRVSTEEQRERQSIATQRDFAERYCAHQQISIVDFYADDGVSGTVPLDQRPQGARMFSDARVGKFDAVLVYKLDRLGRESLLILQAVQQFQAMDVPVKSMTESIEADTPEGEFNLTILSGVATLERKNILRRSAEGIGRLVREGAWVGGVAPYGYRVKGRHREARLVVSDVRLPGSRLTESDVIRLVFRMAGDEGKSCLAIADALNQLSIPAALSLPLSEDHRGKRRRATAGLWRDSRIQYILRNPTYKGVHLYGKRPKKPGKKRAVVERLVAAIVDAELWERAQETLKRNRLFCRPNSQRTYLLRGLMKCAHCGWTYVGTVYTSAGRPERPYYVCGGRHKGRKIAPDPASRCRGMAVTGDIEDVIWADVERFVRNPGPVLEELLQRLTKTTEQGASAEARLEGLRSSLAGKDAERERLIGLFRRGRIDDATLDKELDEVEGERNDLRTQIQALESEGDQARAQEKDLVTAAQLLAELNLPAGGRMTQELKRQVIEKLVAGVIVETLGEGAERDSLVRVTYRFGVPEPSIDPCTDRGIRVLQTLALPLGYAAIPLLANSIRLARDLAGYSTGYRFQPHHPGPDHRVGDAPVALRGRDGRVTQEQLKGGQTTAPVNPRASERVPQHVHVEPLHARQLPRHSRETTRLGEAARSGSGG